ncbi:hypothetical protein [Arthrobacter sp. A2-55]|uniref:hypothetical protein n=1 Tax=Arthrobacter sp. A2-55 TaxID=2897337 RepID=UPI0021CDAC61|nr:hypothetical protein [Arthrobacter sp. A2-55]MCU6481967.1 hypothetical protein [Arthrobacter sp. A2-55]
MSILPSTYILRQPVQHRVTLIEGGVEISYIGRTYDNYYPDGLLTRYVSPESHDRESFPIVGCYLIEELA